MARTKADKAAQEEPLDKQLWMSADKLRKNIDAAEYKHVVLAKGSLTGKSGGEGDIRRALVAGAKLIDGIVNLPAKVKA